MLFSTKIISYNSSSITANHNKNGFIFENKYFLKYPLVCYIFSFRRKQLLFFIKQTNRPKTKNENEKKVKSILLLSSLSKF